jgi:hypothetical protein
MYYSYIEFEYVATSFSPARTDLALKLLKYGHVPPKLVIMTPWRALCVDLVGPYTLNG